jgi:hypothetical protein
MGSDAARDLLLYAVLPVWVLAGFSDYLCHRALKIEHANGVRESLLHWLMLGEVGAAILAGTFLHIDAAVFLFVLACLIAHEVTTHFDLKLATATRLVPPIEQQIHSLLEMLPFTAFLLIAVLQWEQVLALIGHGTADFSVRLAPFPGWTALGIGGSALVLFGLIPYVEELLRGYRAEARRSK